MSATPGYYPDPYTGAPRWWDGSAWGPATPAVANAQPAANAQTEYQGGLVAAGYIFAVLMPLVGFILGLVVVTRPSRATSKHGLWIIVVSIVAFFVFLGVISAQEASTTYDYSSY